MKLHLKFQITRFMLVILLLMWVILPTLSKAKNLNQSTTKSTENNIVEELPEEALGEEINNADIASKNNITTTKKTNKSNIIKEYILKQGETKLIIISNLGLNHIRTNIENPRIHTAAKISVEIDGYNIYINTINREKPVDLFIEAQNGNVYSLTLIPKQVPPQSLYFKAVDYQPNKIKERSKILQEQIPAFLEGKKLNSYYIDYLKNIIKKMSLNQEIQGFIKDDNVREGTIIDDLSSKLLVRYTGSELLCEIWQITNIGNESIQITPKDFYSKNTLSVAIELKNSITARILNSDESCKIYIIKKIEGDND